MNGRSEWEVRDAKSSDIDAVIAFRDIILNKLKDEGREEWMVRRERDEFEEMLSDGIWFKVVENYDDIVAYVSMVFEPSGMRHMLEYESVKKLSDTNKIAYFKFVAVHPDWRGFGMGRILIEEAEKAAREQGFNVMVTMCSPHNTPSMSNFYKCGYELIENVKYDGMQRCVLSKEL